MDSPTEEITGVGLTALWVASLRAIASAATEPLINDEFAKHLAGNYGLKIHKKIEGEGFQDSTRIAAIAKRTYLLDLLLLEAVQKNNIKQVVNLGCGLDTKPYRINFPSGVTFYEIDVSAVIEYKKKILNELHATPKCQQLISIAMDLTNKDEWATQLLQKGFDKNKPSIFITEGLLYYLHDEEMNGVLKLITKLSASESVIIGDMLPTVSFNGSTFRLLREKYRQYGFDVYFHTNDMKIILKEHGFKGTNIIYSTTSPKKYRIIDKAETDSLYLFIGVKKDPMPIKSKL